jgi:stage II sporulation protein R
MRVVYKKSWVLGIWGFFHGHTANEENTPAGGGKNTLRPYRESLEEGTHSMKKKIIIRHILALSLGICFTALAFARIAAKTTFAPSSAPTGEEIMLYTDKENILRLHVLANSDSQEDQAVKLLVRDALLPYFAETKSYADAREFLLENGGDMQRVCEATLAENGFDYGVQLELGTSSFPDREYNGAVFPAGEYNALRVLLGNAQGQNWWCVLFPPLCIVTETGKEQVDMDSIEFESDIWNWLQDFFGNKAITEVQK